MPSILLNPFLHKGIYVFSTISDTSTIPASDILMSFKETEGITIILKKEIADLHDLDYTYLASWITLGVQTSLSMVGLTAKFSTALAEQGISCNVVAAFYHDHIFVNIDNTEKAMDILSHIEI